MYYHDSYMYKAIVSAMAVTHSTKREREKGIPLWKAMMLRFIPYTVVGGFLAGSGILILQARSACGPHVQYN